MKLPSLLLALVCAAGLHAEPTGATPTPTVPDNLKPFKATLSNRRDLGLTLTLQSETGLAPEQWDAVAKMGVRSYLLIGGVSDDAGLARLATLDPVALSFSHSPMTDAGAAKFAEMKSLKVLLMSHTDRLTPAAAAALAHHPALENFANDGKFGIGGLAQIATAPHLRQVLLQHGVASDANVALLAKHPALENVRLWPSGTAVLTDAALPALATIPNLKELTLELSEFSYGGLSALKGAPKLVKLNLNDVLLPEGDLAKLKADLPKVAIAYTPMKPEYKVKWDGFVAKLKEAKPAAQ